MSEDQKKQLEQQLWNIANTLRGKMDADEFRDYILGFIFYKYLSEKMHTYADSILKEDGIKYIDAIREESLEKLGYFLKPSELFSEVAKRGNSDKEGENNFILEDLAKEYEGQIYIYKVDTEAEQELAGAFGIRSIPSILFCPMDGAPQMAQGAMPKESFRKVIADVLLKK